jgi:hypothetical protein
MEAGLKPQDGRALLSTLMVDPNLLHRFRALRDRVFPIKPSQYDVTNLCNLSCVGCLYFEGANAFVGKVEQDHQTLSAFYREEAARGVNFAHFGGAEPSLNQAALAAANAHIARGVVYTNGLRKISGEIGYRLHISVWATGETEHLLRGSSAFRRALRNYAGDPRVVFVLTLTHASLAHIGDVAKACADGGFTLTFNQFSEVLAHEQGHNHLRPAQLAAGAESLPLQLLPEDARHVRDEIELAQQAYPDVIVYSPEYFDWFRAGRTLHRLDPETGWSTNCVSRLSARMRHYLPDLSRDVSSKCCTPNVDCRSCRLYSMSYSTRIGELADQADDIAKMERWLTLAETWEALFCPPSGTPWLEGTRSAKHPAGAPG